MYWSQAKAGFDPMFSKLMGGQYYPGSQRFGGPPQVFNPGARRGPMQALPQGGGKLLPGGQVKGTTQGGGKLLPGGQVNGTPQMLPGSQFRASPEGAGRLLTGRGPVKGWN